MYSVPKYQICYALIVYIVVLYSTRDDVFVLISIMSMGIGVVRLCGLIRNHIVYDTMHTLPY